MNKNGFSLVLFIVLSIFVISPVVFLLTFPNKEDKESVKGVSTQAYSNGVLVTVSSAEGTWDLSKYLCDDRETCLENLTSGKELSTVSGGAVTDHSVYVENTSLWEDYSFIKIFVRNGWGTSGANFVVTDLGSVEGTLREAVSYKNNSYDVVLIPISSVKRGPVKGPVFSNL